MDGSNCTPWTRESFVPAKPQNTRTLFVVMLLVVAAALFSYLGAFAATNALVAAEVIRPFPPDADPRLRWELTAFGGILGCFALVCGLLRTASRRQLKRIDRMTEDDPA